MLQCVWFAHLADTLPSELAKKMTDGVAKNAHKGFSDFGPCYLFFWAAQPIEGNTAYGVASSKTVELGKLGLAGPNLNLD